VGVSSQEEAEFWFFFFFFFFFLLSCLISLSVQDVFERHKVVLTLAASLASAGAAWAGM
jgi:hypothetical protein